MSVQSLRWSCVNAKENAIRPSMIHQGLYLNQVFTDMSRLKTELSRLINECLLFKQILNENN